MRELSPSEILGAWERGRGRTLPERALDLLAAGGRAEAPERLPVGERDALLVELREQTLGPSLEAVVECPSCGEQLELTLRGADLRQAPTAVLEPGGSLRVPTAGDLVAVAAAANVEDGRRILLDRVVDGALEPAFEDAIAERLADADPGAWTELELACPECDAHWRAPFDIVSFLCAELDAAARRLVEEVHSLASAYGWTEHEVLALSSARRGAYLELVGA